MVEEAQILIAAISAAYAKLHPDKPGVFECKELRCPVSKHFTTCERSDASDRFSPNYCPICHGTGYREPGLKFILKKIRELIGWKTDKPKLYPVRDMMSGKDYWYCEVRRGGEILICSDMDPTIAAFRAWLAALKTKTKTKKESRS